MIAADGTLISDEALHLSYRYGGAPSWWQKYIDLNLPTDIKSLDTAYHKYVKAERNMRSVA